MKKITFKKIDLLSVFKLVAGMSLIIGFVIGLFSGGFGNQMMQNQMSGVPFIGGMMNGFMGALLFGLFSGIFSGLAVVIQAVLYNVFAMIFGGIEIEVDEA